MSLPYVYCILSILSTLLHQLEGGGFDSRWRPWKFLLSQSLLLLYADEIDSASNTNEYQEYFLGGKGGRCLRLTTLPPSCSVLKSRSLKVLEASRATQGLLYLYQYLCHHRASHFMLPTNSSRSRFKLSVQGSS